MATRIELPKEIVASAIQKHIASLQRALKEATNPVIKQALEQELQTTIQAKLTISETK